MANPQHLSLLITVQRPVQDETEADAIYDLIKSKLDDIENLKIEGRTTRPFIPQPPS